MTKKSLQRSMAADSQTQLSSMVFKLEKREEFYEYMYELIKFC